MEPISHYIDKKIRPHMSVYMYLYTDNGLKMMSFRISLQ